MSKVFSNLNSSRKNFLRLLWISFGDSGFVGGVKKMSVPEALSLARPASVKKGAKEFEAVGGRGIDAGGRDGPGDGC
jgi:hypothetical protein